MPRSQYSPSVSQNPGTVPFQSVEEAWFWCVQARTAQIQGARVAAGMGSRPRPCEPLDILTVIDRLYRRRRLLGEHMKVLADYGRQLLRPDHDLRRERRDAWLWDEALGVIAPVLREKGIVG